MLPGAREEGEPTLGALLQEHLWGDRGKEGKGDGLEGPLSLSLMEAAAPPSLCGLHETIHGNHSAQRLLQRPPPFPSGYCTRHPSSVRKGGPRSARRPPRGEDEKGLGQERSPRAPGAGRRPSGAGQAHSPGLGSSACLCPGHRPAPVLFSPLPPPPRAARRGAGGRGAWAGSPPPPLLPRSEDTRGRGQLGSSPTRPFPRGLWRDPAWCPWVRWRRPRGRGRGREAARSAEVGNELAPELGEPTRPAASVCGGLQAEAQRPCVPPAHRERGGCGGRDFPPWPGRPGFSFCRCFSHWAPLYLPGMVLFSRFHPPSRSPFFLPRSSPTPVLQLREPFQRQLLQGRGAQGPGNTMGKGAQGAENTLRA